MNWPTRLVIVIVVSALAVAPLLVQKHVNSVGHITDYLSCLRQMEMRAFVILDIEREHERFVHNPEVVAKLSQQYSCTPILHGEPPRLLRPEAREQELVEALVNPPEGGN